MWEANPEPDIAGYRLYYGQLNQPATMREIRNATTATVTGLIQERQYYFYLTAFNTSNLESAPSQTVFHTEPLTRPAVPLTLTGTALSSSQLRITWTDNSSNESGFRLKRRAGIYGAETTLVLSSNLTSYTDSRLSPGTLYFYTIESFNASGGSGFSPSITVATMLPPGSDPAPSDSAATFVATDTGTRGTWKGTYGSQGAVAPYSDFLFPTNIQINANYNYPLLIQNLSLDPTALERRLLPTRFASCWRNTNHFTFYLQFKDTAPHQVAFYFADFQNAGSEQNLEFFDYSTGRFLAGTNISNFATGLYSVWNIEGKVTVRLSRVSGSEPSLSGIFIDPSSLPPNEVHFVGSNSTNSGTWLRIFGTKGHCIASEIPSVPPGLDLTISGPDPFIWNAATGDPTALQRPYTRGRIASAWLSSAPITFSLAFNDTDVHRVSLYALDWEGLGRRQSIEILDGDSGTVLDSTEISDFGNGLWLHYDMRGHLQVRVRTRTRANGAVSGIFFD